MLPISLAKLVGDLLASQARLPGAGRNPRGILQEGGETPSDSPLARLAFSQGAPLALAGSPRGAHGWQDAARRVLSLPGVPLRVPLAPSFPWQGLRLPSPALPSLCPRRFARNKSAQIEVCVCVCHFPIAILRRGTSFPLRPIPRRRLRGMCRASFCALLPVCP